MINKMNMMSRKIFRYIIVFSLFLSVGTDVLASCQNSGDTDIQAGKKITITNSCDSLLHSFIHAQTDSILRHNLLDNVFDTLCSGKRPLRVLHIGDSHVAGKSLPMSIKQYLTDAFGMAESDSLGKGIYFSYIAKNGATALNFLTPERMKNIESKNADLVIMSFGTNECHGMGYKEEEHLTSLSAAVDSVCRLCPNATILLTTPPGDYLTKRTRYYIKGKDGKRYRRYRSSRNPNPMTVRCAALIRSFAEQHEMPVWDLNSIAGGDMAVRNWQKYNMMRKDYIHFYPEGYNFQGRMFGEAFIKAYNSYLERDSFIDSATGIIEKYVEY